MLKGWFKSISLPVLAVACAAYLCTSAHGADDPSAFDLMKEGNRYVGEQAKDKVVQLRSEKSVGSLKPKIWYVVYYDPTATFKAVEVKFGAGKMIDVKRPFRVLETVMDSDKVLDKEKLKIDSDKAIEIATKEPLLENLKISAVSARLQTSPSGPVWIVKLWAQKLRKPTEDADIGEVKISADEGKVIQTDLHPNRVD
jgi:hypothetical protein